MKSWKYGPIKSSTDRDYVPTPEELAMYEEAEQREKDCTEDHAAVDEDGCLNCGYGAK